MHISAFSTEDTVVCIHAPVYSQILFRGPLIIGSTRKQNGVTGADSRTDRFCGTFKGTSVIHWFHSPLLHTNRIAPAWSGALFYKAHLSSTTGILLGIHYISGHFREILFFFWELGNKTPRALQGNLGRTKTGPESDSKKVGTATDVRARTTTATDLRGTLIFLCCEHDIVQQASLRQSV